MEIIITKGELVDVFTQLHRQEKDEKILDILNHELHKSYYNWVESELEDLNEKHPFEKDFDEWEVERLGNFYKGLIQSLYRIREYGIGLNEK